MNTAEKNIALGNIALGMAVTPIGKAKFRVGQYVVHVRYCSTNPRAPARYNFNINPNTLSADYELWVCGSAALYYLLPVSFVRSIYDNPKTYIDRTHPELRVVSVEAHARTVTYGSGGLRSDLRGYLRVTIQ